MKHRSTTHLMKLRRIDRKALEHARANPLDAGGLRAGAEEALGFGSPASFPGTPERFRYLAAQWFAS